MQQPSQAMKLAVVQFSSISYTASGIQSLYYKQNFDSSLFSDFAISLRFQMCLPKGATTPAAGAPAIKVDTDHEEEEEEKFNKGRKDSSQIVAVAAVGGDTEGGGCRGKVFSQVLEMCLKNGEELSSSQAEPQLFHSLPLFLVGHP